MRTVSQTVRIDRPAEAVFDYLEDMEHIPEWMPEDFARVRRQPDSRFIYETRGGRVRGTWEWEETERPRRLRWSGPPVRVGPIGTVEGRGQYTLTPDEGGTLVQVSIEPRFGGAIKLLTPVTLASMQRRLKSQVQRLKQRVEALGPA